VKKSNRDALIAVGSITSLVHLANVLFVGATPLTDAVGIASIVILLVAAFVRVDTSEQNDGPADAR
jgi:hypothetical protein